MKTDPNHVRTCFAVLLLGCGMPASPTLGGEPTGSTSGERPIRLGVPRRAAEGIEGVVHKGPVRSVAFSPDGKAVVTASTDAVIAWDADTGRPRRRVFPAKGLYVEACGAALAFAPDGRWLAVAEPRFSYFLFDRRGVHALAPPKSKYVDEIQTMAFSPDGTLLALGGNNGAVGVFRMEETEPVRVHAEGRAVRAIAFSPDGRLLAVAAKNNLLHMSTTNGEYYSFQHGSHGPCDPIAVSFSRDGGTLLAAYSRGSVLRWEVATRMVRQQLPQLPQSDAAADSVTRRTAALFSPDGRLLACGHHDGSATVWDVVAGRILWRRKEHLGAVVSLAFSPDGGWLATGSEDGTALLWDVRAVKAIEKPRKATPLSHKDLNALWDDLGCDDAEKAFRAVQALVAAPEKATAYLAARCRLSDAERQRLARRIADLDADEYDTRSRACAELQACCHFCCARLQSR